jgi:hypothetical protein
MDRPTPAARPRRSTAVLAVVLHLLVLWPYAASGLLAPGWAVAALLALWVTLAAVVLVVHRRYGAVAALVPLAALALWFGALTAGDLWLGWTG